MREYKENALFNVFEKIYDKVIFTLHFPADKKLERKCFAFFLNIWYRVKSGTKFRGAEKLSPITIFMFFNMRGLNLDIKDISDKINISDKKIRQGLKEIIKIYPEYLKKDRKVLALNKLAHIKTSFTFPEEFMENSKAILEKFWPYIRNTKENVIAGTVCVLTIIAMDIKEYNYSQICASIGIAQSTVIYQIKNNLFKRLRITGFETISKSNKLIKDLIIKNIDIKLPK